MERIVPELRHLMDFDVKVEAPLVVDANSPVRRVVRITEGVISGRYTGRVLPGADWHSVRGDGLVDLSAHYALEIDGHGAVEVRSEGLRAGPPEVLAAIARGEQVAASQYYFRTAIRFRTGATGLAWLNEIICVGAGTRFVDRVIVNVYEVT